MILIYGSRTIIALKYYVENIIYMTITTSDA